MGSSCIVVGCTEKSRKGKGKGKVVFHTFPKDIERRKQWLRAVKNHKYTENIATEDVIPLRVCSLHFKPEDYEAEKMGKYGKLLKLSAVPTIDLESPGPSSEPPAKRPRTKPEAGDISAPTTSSAAGSLSANDGSGPSSIQPPSLQAPQTSGENTAGPSPLTITPISASSTVTKRQTVNPPTSTPVKLLLTASCPGTPLTTLDSSFSSIEGLGVTDDSYCPETTVTPSTTSTSSSDEEIGTTWDEKKIIINQSCLMSLFKFCQKCGQPIVSKKISFFRAQARVNWSCLGGHSDTFLSSPNERGMPQVDLLAAASVMFSGGTYTELADWSKAMNLQIIGSKTFYNIQSAYLFPAIENLYQQRRTEMLARVFFQQEDGKRPELLGDGRCDTPGFNAKYCHYSFMLDDTKEIIHTELVQVTEASNSGAMEPLGFKRGMTELLNEGLEVEVMTTDRSSSIRKMMKDEFPEINHQFDIWHTAKGFRKKMSNKGKKRGKEALVAWTRSITNHMWFTCGTCKGDTEDLKRRWVSILHHVCGVHEWTENGQTHRCLHAPLTAQEQKERVWIRKESLVFAELSSMVQNKRLLKDLEQMCLFKHTGPLEVFHSALLKYAPKRQHFQYMGMKERCHLAILEHNENIVKREQATSANGQPRFNEVWCKRSRQWVLKKIFKPHTKEFVPTLIKDVITRRLNPNIPYKAPTSSLALPQPALPSNIAPVPKPPMQDLIADYRSRF